MQLVTIQSGPSHLRSGGWGVRWWDGADEILNGLWSNISVGLYLLKLKSAYGIVWAHYKCKYNNTAGLNVYENVGLKSSENKPARGISIQSGSNQNGQNFHTFFDKSLIKLLSPFLCICNSDNWDPRLINCYCSYKSNINTHQWQQPCCTIRCVITEKSFYLEHLVTFFYLC